MSDPKRLLLAGGEQEPVKAGVPHRYERARIVIVDADSGKCESTSDYISPADVVPPDHQSVTFKAGSVFNNSFWVCTTTEVLRYDFARGEFCDRFTHPWFNDLHHVHPTPEGTFLVAATGMDLVLECDLDGVLRKEWPVLAGEPWSRLNPNLDYRLVASTKPHASHPNYVWRRGDEIWVNRLKQNDAICLNADRKPLPLLAQSHDGIWFEDEWWFTTVDGRIHIFDAESLEVRARFDLNGFERSGDVLGWCRSILPLPGRRAWVGFSRLRPTKFAEHVSWIKNAGRMIYRPTRLVLYDLEAGRIEREIQIERFGIHALFAIHDPERPTRLA